MQKIITSLLLLLLTPLAMAQIYYVDGRTVCCGDLVNNLNNNAGIINPANLGAVQVKSSSFKAPLTYFWGTYTSVSSSSDTI